MKSKVVMFAAALAFAASGAAFATKPGNSGGGNGGCGQGQQTNGCGGSSGGAGFGVGVGVGIGQGGNASATGGRGGEGGSVIGSGNSSNANSNKQAQGQQQSSKNRNDNRSSANATGGSNTNSNANSGNNSDQSVTVQGDSYDAPRIPVATAYAPNIAPTAVCMGSSSAGAQGVTFGVSLGTSWTDDNCMLLEQVRTVASVIGDREIAAEMMCEVKAYKEARARAGKPCGSTQPAAAIAPQTMGDNHQPKYGPVAVANVPVVVSPVPPSVERIRVTLDGLQAVR